MELPYGGILARGQFITGFHKAAIKVVNYKELQEVIQGKHENQSQFLDHLTRPSYKVPLWILKPQMENNTLSLTSSPRVSLTLGPNLGA